MKKYKVESDGAVLTVRFTGVRPDWEQWILVSSDRHHDNIYCRRDLELSHLKQAQEREALIIDCGDLFCAMQGKYDPRSNMDDIRPEDVGINYLDRIVSHAAEDYGPFAENWLMIGKGNHETNILKRHHTDLVSNLVHRLNSEYGGRVMIGGYGGWVRFMFKIHKTVGKSVRIKYHHGAGGGGPVTRGTIQTNRQAVYMPDADVCVNGHTHDSWILPIARERLTDMGKISRDLIWFVRTPGYKDEYADGSRGFHIEKWGAPKPIGACWLRMYYENKTIRIDATQAVA